ncbi:hypothetical protein COPEUT_00108 [Coprococcus eutactus ATCC 27759]|nr:hypothetical protein COPEUT_00108 [Coprococcus eutactus ATCC 27759]
MFQTRLHIQKNKIKAAELLTYNSAAVFLCNTVMIMCIL